MSQRNRNQPGVRVELKMDSLLQPSRQHTQVKSLLRQHTTYKVSHVFYMYNATAGWITLNTKCLPTGAKQSHSGDPVIQYIKNVHLV